MWIEIPDAFIGWAAKAGWRTNAYNTTISEYKYVVFSSILNSQFNLGI